jgi:sodium transport system permease protein
MAFSMVTSALNLVCVAVTGGLVFRQMAGFGGPPAMAAVWLVLALLPVSALFSALCLALASFARSTKEGQYYLMPLMMLTLPLAVIPMAPGVELSLGNALIPVSGIVLLLKTLLEESYGQALQYVPVVLAVTFAACWLSVRWAVEQFNTESVLFRESERFDVRLWFQHLRCDRAPLPSAGEGVFCGLVIVAIVFVFRVAAAPPRDFNDLVRTTMALQLAAVFAPAVIMAVMLTSRPRQTLLLKLPRWRMVPAAAVLAVSLHPFIVALAAFVLWLYPIAPEVRAELEKQGLFASGNLWMLLLVIAAIPAICEELAFRGFILSGCRSLGNSRRAIVVSAILFGFVHFPLQQSISAFVAGLVLGYLAVRSGSLLPGVVFHFLNNAVLVLAAKITPEMIGRHPLLGHLVQWDGHGSSYQWPVYLFCGVTALAVLGWFTWFPEARNAEELLQEAFHSAESMERTAG